MRTRLLHPDRSFDPDAALPPLADDLERDLGLGVIVEAMAAGDPAIAEVARSILLAGPTDLATVRHRQDVLADALDQPDLVRELHAVACDAVIGEARIWGAFLDRYPESVLGRATQVLELFLVHLRRLRHLTERGKDLFTSAGFRDLVEETRRDLDDDYLATLDDHLERLRLRGGIVMTASLGPGNRGADYVLRKPRTVRPPLQQRVPVLDRAGFTYQVPDATDQMTRALNDLKARGIAPAASALGRSTDHILAFFTGLRAELAWLVACLNLHDRITALRIASSRPAVHPGSARRLGIRGLTDLSLALLVPEGVVANDLDADGRGLVVITGANRGGKSTFLRAVGQAQLMLQAGCFVAAGACEASLADGIFTHFKREEDLELVSGKLDEELRRMRAIVDNVGPESLVMLNESFSSTTEREGSEIARQVIRALVESGVRVLAVTHLFDLADTLRRDFPTGAAFLRAEREADGRRTFRIVEGPPLPTSFAADLYREVFGRSIGGDSGGTSGGQTGVDRANPG